MVEKGEIKNSKRARVILETIKIILKTKVRILEAIKRVSIESEKIARKNRKIKCLKIAY
jgi:hypothetical protein